MDIQDAIATLKVRIGEATANVERIRNLREPEMVDAIYNETSDFKTKYDQELDNAIYNENVLKVTLRVVEKLLKEEQEK